MKRFEIYYLKPHQPNLLFMVVGIACCIESMTRFFEDRGYIIDRILEHPKTPTKAPLGAIGE